MKVLHVTFSDNFGGANIAALRLHEALESKINSKLIVFNKRKNKKNILQFKDSTFFNIKLKNYIAKIILLFFSKTNNHSLNIFNSKLLNVINDSDADIIHLHWINNELLSIQDISKIKKKIVWTDMICGLFLVLNTTQKIIDLSMDTHLKIKIFLE